MTYHKPHWTKRQVQSLNKAIREGATVAFTLTGPEGEPYNGGESPRDQYARPGLVQESDGPLRLCEYGVFHVTLKPQKWLDSKVWIVALYGKVQRYGDFKLGALKQEFIGEVLAHEALDPKIGVKLGRKDLAGVDFSCVDFEGANLNGANLSGAYFSYANLSGADLERANLYKADLRGADLSCANLYQANLSGADFRGANLSGANFMGVNLGKASLYRANLNKASLSGANLGDWERGPDGFARRKQ